MTRPSPDPYLRKCKPIVNRQAQKDPSIAEIINRGNQLLIELDRQHSRLHDTIRDALRPEPRAWKSAKAAKADYDQAYSELINLSKRINIILQKEYPELLDTTPPETGCFGFVPSAKKRHQRRAPCSKGDHE
jgi:hypothetical protein